MGMERCDGGWAELWALSEYTLSSLRGILRGWVDFCSFT